MAECTKDIAKGHIHFNGARHFFTGLTHLLLNLIKILEHGYCRLNIFAPLFSGFEKSGRSVKEYKAKPGYCFTD